MRRSRAIVAIVGVWMLIASIPTVAAASLDTSSTSRFVSASLRIERTALARVGRIKASANALIDHVASTCPGAVPGSVGAGTAAQQRVEMDLIDAALGELELAEARPLRSAEMVALREAAPLRWTPDSLNRRVAALIRNSRAPLAAHPPDLCAAARTAAESNYTVVLFRAFTGG